MSMKNYRPYCMMVALLLVATASAQTSKKEIFSDIYRTGSNYFAYPGGI